MTVTTQTAASAAKVAAAIRDLSDEALCALLDCARWCDDAGALPEIAQSDDAYIAIGEVLAVVEDDLL